VDEIKFLTGLREEKAFTMRDRYNINSNQVMSEFEGNIKDYFTTCFVEYHREDIAETSESTSEISGKAKEDKLTSFILKIIKELDESYYQYKLSKDVLDFGDLQKKALEILENRLMCNNYKQAIYGFRGTDSTIFKRVSVDMGESGLKSLNISIST
jgi:ATP-dependent exoDNAse (exonuclease V) beta subunit